MGSDSEKQLLEQLQQNNDSLKRVLEQQTSVLDRIQRQQEELLARFGPQPVPTKDFWDRTGVFAPIIAAAIIACIGAYFTYSYNQQQIKVQEIQTIEKFFPHLVGDEKSKRAAILAMNSLGNAKLAAKVASIFASEGTASALSSMAKNNAGADQAAINEALYKTLDSLAEKYESENKLSDSIEAYKKALVIKENILGKDNPALVEDLSKLARLYEAQGAHGLADDVNKRAALLNKTPLADTPSNQTGLQPAVAGESKKPNEVVEPRKADTPNTPAPEAETPALQRPDVEPVREEEHEPRTRTHTNVEQ